MTNIEEAFNRLMLTQDGWRKIAAVMISPIRHQLKDLYALDMTKEQEVIVEAEVYKASIMKDAGIATFGYKEAVRLQDKLVKEFKGETPQVPYEGLQDEGN
jgi:hypothetical protein